MSATSCWKLFIIATHSDKQAIDYENIAISTLFSLSFKTFSMRLLIRDDCTAERDNNKRVAFKEFKT